MKRSQLVVLGVLALGVAGGVAWWALSGDPAGAAAPPVTDPVAVDMDPYEQRTIVHREQWPYGQFQDDFAALRLPGHGNTAPLGYDTKLQHELKLQKTTMTVNFRDATPEEVFQAFRERLKDTGIRLIVYPEYLHEVESLRFTFELNEVPLFTVIDHLRGQSEERFGYYVTSEGLCLGGVSSRQQCQIDAAKTNQGERQREESRDPRLEVTYRPDFDGAFVGNIARQITDQTGVEVIVDHATWINGRKMSWRGAPMPLREALERICSELRCAYRVRGERVFLISP